MSEIQFHIIMVQDVITSDIIIYNTMSLFVLRASPPLRVGRYRTQHSKTHGIILLSSFSYNFVSGIGFFALETFE